ncbi:zinc transport system permease protein [Rhodovulum imhoffii]|uniref:High-affinity zinc uptake system membrane protein ZnuB n=1 Tax=Rhodovulum imhoffii TaxID=365340 RepID=A0A2T5BVY5_9RHOB|nr:metal ABC transporter permease [Rhodovulum imhoffii]MBK5933557.1 hypothetical protein [Rhodovulum imhoffii]PTN03811.1 zinc transport system permease protein [Rhodovulum imhoffii]
MLNDFMVRAALAGLAVALAAGPLGSFVVWRRMAYFGEATAHAAILGVALGLAFSVSVFAGTLAAALAMGLTVSSLTGRGLAVDSALGVLSHGALAAGLVAVAFLPGVRVDLDAYLFGDILAVSRGDLALIWGGALVVLSLLAWRWNALLTVTVSEDLATASGLVPAREKLVLTLALALVVAVALQVVGALLIVALLIVPPAAARAFVQSPEMMAAGASAVAALSVLGGLWGSLQFDTPAGPSIVVTATLFFVLSLLTRR